jgi:hypothetical protein
MDWHSPAMKSLIFLALFLTASLTRADVLIYKIKLSETQTGQGAVTKIQYSGYVVIDPGISSIAEIAVLTSAGTFSTTWPSNFVFAQVSGGLAKKYTAFSRPTLHFGTLSIIGQNTLLDSGTIAQWQRPKVFKATATDVDSVEGTVTTGTGTLTFDQVDTINANTLQFGDINQTVTALEQILLGQGFTEN